MADGFAEMHAQIERLRSLGPALVREAAPTVAKAIEGEIVAQISRGEGPDGTPWPLTKEGKRPLVHAAKALTVRAVDDIIVCRLEGPEALHHRGAVKGGTKRPILPTTGLTQPITRAIASVLAIEFADHMGAAR